MAEVTKAESVEVTYSICDGCNEKVMVQCELSDGVPWPKWAVKAKEAGWKPPYLSFGIFVPTGRNN